MQPADENEVLYLVAVRTKLDPAKTETHTYVMEAMERALEVALPPEAVARGTVVTKYSALTANHNGYLREFGFDFDTANQLITVATMDPEASND